MRPEEKITKEMMSHNDSGMRISENKTVNEKLGKGYYGQQIKCYFFGKLQNH